MEIKDQMIKVVEVLNRYIEKGKTRKVKITSKNSSKDKEQANTHEIRHFVYFESFTKEEHKGSYIIPGVINRHTENMNECKLCEIGAFLAEDDINTNLFPVCIIGGHADRFEGAFISVYEAKGVDCCFIIVNGKGFRVEIKVEFL